MESQVNVVFFIPGVGCLPPESLQLSAGGKRQRGFRSVRMLQAAIEEKRRPGVRYIEKIEDFRNEKIR